MKEKVFSVTRKDFRVDTFRSGGKGGQHQNKTDSGVRITHADSGAVAESRNHRSQYQNRKAALNRLTASAKFRLWVNRRIFEIDTGKTIENRVDEMMADRYLKIECI